MDVTVKSNGKKILITKALVEELMKESEWKFLEVDTKWMLFYWELQGTFISRWTHFMVTAIGWIVFVWRGIKCIADLILLLTR